VLCVGKVDISEIVNSSFFKAKIHSNRQKFLPVGFMEEIEHIISKNDLFVHLIDKIDEIIRPV